ncbi:hypothetical protein [uncultured Modestobacter sp.]|uniref:hypothetical protein n=1 Tax=uncultured Modestobacter sp. TaxID=380048 RepID=UPI0026029FBF|nr:hypothetical protein [uncultured Modestobacter sp.]
MPWTGPNRDEVDAALTAAGTRVGTLAFAVPAPVLLGEPMVLDVRWLAAVAASRTPSERLVLRVWAVPDADVPVVAGLLTGGGLARACAWAAASTARESPAGRRCVLTHAGGALHVLEG